MRSMLHRQPLGIALVIVLSLTALLPFLGSATAQPTKQEKSKYKDAEEAYRAGIGRDLAKSRPALEEALRLAPNDNFKIKVYRALTPVYRSLPEIDKMVEALEFIIANSESAAERSLTRSDLLSFVHQRGKVKELASRQEDRLKKMPNDMTALYLLAELYDRWLPNAKRGIEVNERLGAILKKEEGKLDVRTASQLARQYVQAGKLKEGAELYEKIAPLDTRQSARHWLDAAQAWLKAKEKDKALAAAKTSVGGKPESHSELLIYFWHMGLADVFVKTGETKLAVEQYEKALAHADSEYSRRDCLGRLAELRSEKTKPAPAGKFDLHGSITETKGASEAARKQGTLGWIVVQESKEKPAQYGLASIRVTAKTLLKKQIGEERRDATFDDLKPGVQVMAKFIGSVAESFPVQATGGEILITIPPALVVQEAALARQLVQAGKWKEGAHLYEKIAPLDAKLSAWHWKEAAQTWLKAKEKDKAVAAAKASAAAKPEKRSELLTFFWHKGLADVFLETGEAKLAIEHYEQALKHTDIEGSRRDCLGRLAEAREGQKKTAAPPPVEKFDIHGAITATKVASAAAKKEGVLGWIVVKEIKGAKPGLYDVASIRVTTKTVLKKMVGTERQDASFDDLRLGVLVKTRFSGGVDDSYPVQATSAEILILPAATAPAPMALPSGSSRGDTGGPVTPGESAR